MAKAIQIKLPIGVLQLSLQDYTWEIAEGTDERMEIAKMMANIFSANYEYSPGDGQPGYYLATKVAKEIKGEAILPKVEQGKEGVVY